jgi:hypothetical protein
MSIIQQFEKICPGIRIVSSNDLQLLRAPIFEEAYVQQFRIKEQKLKLLISRLDHLNPHVAYFLLKNCLFIPSVMNQVGNSNFPPSVHLIFFF